MTKCGRMGCTKEGIHLRVPIMGGMMEADACFCAEHMEEGLASLREA